MINKYVLIVLVSFVMLPNLILADDDFDESWTEILGFDDWPAFNMLAEGKMWCPGGELAWLNPLTPDCGKGKRSHMRDAEMYSCFTALGMDYAIEPRMTGVIIFGLAGNLDSKFSGPVHGKWMLVPSETCDPANLVDPPVYWEGTWQGKRVQVCDPTCWWVGNLRIVGYGYGGNLEGLEFQGEEVITTYTLLPAPWEHIPGFPYTGPEGVAHGFIKE